MKIADSTVLITGANRGIGLAFAKAFLARGARKVYAGARDPSSITLSGVEPLKLDVTSDSDVEAAIRIAGDVNIVVGKPDYVTSTREFTGEFCTNGTRADDSDFHTVTPKAIFI